jgi:hypothetical protein
MSELNELRNTRVNMAEREKEKLESRFTELPTPVYNPPPSDMPTNSEAVQRVLDRRALEVGKGCECELSCENHCYLTRNYSCCALCLFVC